MKVAVHAEPTPRIRMQLEPRTALLRGTAIRITQSFVSAGSQVPAEWAAACSQ